jgi:2Fe-2S ferredoxin
MTNTNITVYIEPADGQKFELQVPLGMNIMRAAVEAGVRGIVGECGGATMCGTCHVYTVDGPVSSLAAVTPAEEQMLEWTVAERLPSSRLSCQLVANEAMAGLVLKLPETQA